MSKAPALADSDIAYNIHPYTNLALHEQLGPLVIDRGENIYVWDDKGKQYIEGLAGLWCTSLGFSEPRLIEAAMRQFKRLPFSHSFAHRTNEATTRLAERLIEVAPANMAKAYFVNSGSEAIDMAIKIIWYYNNGLGRPEKKKLISRKRGYHGVTIAAGSLTAIPLMQNDFDLPLDRMMSTDTPSYYRCGEPGETEDEFTDRIVGNLEKLILDEGPETIAAFFAEPVMGAGGVIVPPAGYFDKVQPLLKKYDILFVADEVICGFGRTGNWWGSQTFGITPDIVTCAKQLSSAYLPIAAVMISDSIYQALVEQSKKHGSFGTGNTYGGHPVACAVALETLAIYEERNIMDHVRNMSAPFQQRLHQLSDHPLVGESRGVGLLGGIEIVANKETRASFDAAAKAAFTVTQHAQKHGLLVRPLPSDSIGICPPLIITEEQIHDLFDRLKAGLDDALADLK
jgi:4-aminobutyrate--pyruvate transaminase